MSVHHHRETNPKKLNTVEQGAGSRSGKGEELSMRSKTVFLRTRTLISEVCLLVLGIARPASLHGWRMPPAQQANEQRAAAKQLGTITAISGNEITLSSDAHSEIRIVVLETSRLVRIEPGQKDLKNATPVQLKDLQVGDRILARGKASDDGKSLVSSGIIVMRSSDLEATREKERAEWQKSGVGGLVTAVNSTTGDATISTNAFGAKKSVVVHTSTSTVVRRYAPDSVKFDDAKTSTLDQLKPGDQLRARGTRSADGSEFTAKEVVSGSFRNIAGTVSAIDPSSNTIRVTDVIAKQSVVVRVTAESQLRKLPPEIAQRIATRLKGANGTGGPGSNAGTPNGDSHTAASGEGRPQGGPPGRSGGPPDLQQMLSRMPAVTLAELQKGDAIMMVATEGTGSGGVTAITLVAGVEPILAAPNGGQMVLSPWSLGSGVGGEDSGQ
jgi:hypothetical protein